MTSLLYDLEKGDIDPTDSKRAVEKISKLLIDCSASLVVPHVKTIKKKNKRNVYVRLPDDVKIARSQCKTAFESWKEKDYPDGNETCENYRSKRREYIVSNYVIFSINLKPKKSRKFATQHTPIRIYFGDS